MTSMADDASLTDPFWTSERLRDLRAQTPGVAHVAHLNNAGAALMSRAVRDATVAHLDLESRIGGYEAADAVAPEIEQLYANSAELLGARPDELGLVESATRAWSSAVSGLRFSPGDRIITTATEYVSNAMGLLRLREMHGVEIDLAPADSTGAADLDALAGLIGPRTRAIALTHVATSGGLVQPAAEIGAIAKEHELLYLVDACQSVGQLDVNVQELNADMVSFTGRKFLRAPRGTGMIWVGKHAIGHFSSHVGMDGNHSTWAEPMRHELPTTARRFTPFELPLAAVMGFGVAVSELLELGAHNVERRVTSLADQLRAGLSEIPGVTIQDLGEHRCGIVTFTTEAAAPADLRDSLRAQGINVSVTGAGSARFDLPHRGLDSLVRASVHYYNDSEDIERLLRHVAAA